MVGALLTSTVLMALPVQGQIGMSLDWSYHGGDAVDRYSPATEITPANVAQLKEAWRFPMAAGGLESQPIMIGRTAYVVTTKRTVMALDAVTGQPKWTFDPGDTGDTQPIRGLTSWKDGDRLRIVFGRDFYLYVLDAQT